MDDGIKLHTHTTLQSSPSLTPKPTTSRDFQNFKMNVISNAVTSMLPRPSWSTNANVFRASVIEKIMKDNPGKPEVKISTSVDSLYMPLFEYISSVMQSTPHKKPVFIGISAPQGAGKTTLTTALQHLFLLDNKQCEILSLDDFYLTAHEQSKVAEEHKHNPLLQYRGNAGTHDLPLLERTLRELSESPRDGNSSVNCHRIPRYDKSLHEGRGDRASEDAWSVVHGSPDVVLLEGWMLGFASLQGASCAALSDDMKEVNSYLQNYKSIHCLMDAWLVIQAEDIDYVYKWRQEAETQMSRSGKPAMSDLQVDIYRIYPVERGSYVAGWWL
jgi:pantothenate kinase-related protein Tda10